MEFVERVSADNLKLVTRNTYNIFHSCKLNLPELVQFIYTPEDNPSYYELLKRLESSSFGPPLIYDLSMAIHFPFFDTEASCIPNLFNLSNSTAINDFRNTYGLPRLLCYLYNNEEISFADMFSALTAIGYSDEYIKKAIQISLDYCLINTEFGVKLDDLNNDTMLSLSSSGIFMLESSICDKRYLSYVCEDTPMDNEYVVEIKEKYTPGSSASNIQNRKKAEDNFVKFLVKEDNRELSDVINKRKWDRHSFLRDFSMFLDGQPVPISKYISRRISEQG